MTSKFTDLYLQPCFISRIECENPFLINLNAVNKHFLVYFISCFIILRGSVSVYIKEGGDEQYQFDNKETDRKKLGTAITTFGNRQTETIFV